MVDRGPVSTLQNDVLSWCVPLITAISSWAGTGRSASQKQDDGQSGPGGVLKSIGRSNDEKTWRLN